MLNYSTTDLNIFLAKAEYKLVELGEKLIVQVTYDTVENCLLDKIYLLTEIIDAINDSSSQEEIDVLVFFALDYYDLYTLPYSPFSVAPTLILSSGGSSGGSGIVYWSDILDKPDTFLPSPHTHVDNDILISLTGITETVGGITPGNFTGTLEQFLIQMLIKYQNPSFTYFAQDKESSFALGQPISATANTVIGFSWTISNSSNVKVAANSGSITVSETSPFVSNLPFDLSANLSGISRTLSGVYAKNEPGSLIFYLNGVASNNNSMNQPSVTLTWYSEIWYGNSVASDIDESTVQGFQSTLTNVRQTSFTINGSGYKYVFIPDNINQSGIKFIDPNSGFEIAMNAPIAKTIVNDYSISLAGQLYRSKNSLGAALTVNIQ